MPRSDILETPPVSPADGTIDVGPNQEIKVVLSQDSQAVFAVPDNQIKIGSDGGLYLPPIKTLVSTNTHPEGDLQFITTTPEPTNEFKFPGANISKSLSGGSGLVVIFPSSAVQYVNSNSGLTAITAQAAIDELANAVPLLESERTSNFTATLGKLHPVNCTSSAITITPPSNPQARDTFAISDSRGNASINNITINFSTASQNLHGSVQNYVVDVDQAYVEFIYINNTVGWITK